MLGAAATAARARASANRTLSTDRDQGGYMRRVGDRRSTVRLEVVGALWGTLEVRKPARVININREGALLEYPIPVVADTVHTVTVEREGQRVSFDVRVRHVQAVSRP